jgi:glycosyltransferase involved in cell wall biosynthesis
VPPGDAARLAEAVDRLIEDEDLGRRLAERARETARRSLTLEKMAADYLALYEEARGDAAERRGPVWLTWDSHRRTNELAARLRVPVRVVARPKFPVLDQAWPLAKTLAILAFTRRRAIIVQNPSLLLSSAAALLKPWKGYGLVQDLHSYFIQHMDRPRGIFARVYRRLSLFCLRRADVTVVTNEPLRARVDRLGGRGFVLQDAIPSLSPRSARRRAGTERRVVFVSTYSADEPTAEVVEAARRLPPSVVIQVTGRVPRDFDRRRLPPNVRLTGFLSEADYAALLDAADAVLVLTTREHTLVCGAYEGAALGKPLILSDTEALRAYFSRGAVYVRNEADALARGIRRALAEAPRLAAETDAWRRSLAVDWERRFGALRAEIARLGPRGE